MLFLVCVYKACPESLHGLELIPICQ